MAEGGQMDENQNSHVGVFHRLAGFPLVQSAYQIASFAYGDVKRVHPAVGYFCEVLERGVKAASDLAVSGVSPILKVMEPQVTAINNLALRLVEELHIKLPILDQPADEVVSEFRERLVGGVRALKERALDRARNVLDRTQATARESYETISIAASLLGTLEVRDMVKVAAYFVVTQAEDLVDLYLPEESNRGPESSSGSSDSADGMDGARYGLMSRSWELVRSVVTRSLRKLRPFLERYRNFLESGVTNLLSLLSQVRRCVQAALWLALPRNPTQEEVGPKATVRKKKPEAPPRLSRSPGKTTHSGLPQGSLFRVSANGRRPASDAGGGNARERRRQSSDNSSNPRQIQEDAGNNIFFP